MPSVIVPAPVKTTNRHLKLCVVMTEQDPANMGLKVGTHLAQRLSESNVCLLKGLNVMEVAGKNIKVLTKLVGNLDTGLDPGQSLQACSRGEIKSVACS